jgi:apolipoprotein N-acyltransferase
LASLLSVFLTWVSWTPIGLVFPVFVAFIPLLYIAINGSFSATLRLIVIFASLFLENASITFWITEMSVTGAVASWLVNSILLTTPFIWLVIRKTKGYTLLKFTLFISHWIIVEYIQLNAGFGFPFMLLGNTLAGAPWAIQWYSFTGVLGGSFWILLINITIFELFKNKLSISRWSILAFILFVPMLISLMVPTKRTYGSLKAVVVHPDVNCYTEKFTKSSNQLVEEYIELSQSVVDEQTELVVWPETAITDLGWISDLPNHPSIRLIGEEMRNFPNLSLLTGAIVYEKSPVTSPESSFSEEFNTYFKSYNSAVFLNFNKKQIDIRYKEKLVPFEEYQPYPRITLLVSKIFDAVTGLKFAQKQNKSNLINISANKVMPLICYEILFGEFISQKGGNANAYCLLMNEGWYDNLWASSQFWSITKLRSIEQGKSILVSSNRGHSGIVNPDGTDTRFSERSSAALSVSLPLARNHTFYSQHGDIIIQLITFSFIVALLFLFVMTVKKIILSKRSIR